MKWKGAAGENWKFFFHIVQKGADGVDVNEGCFSAKRFPRRGAQAPKNCPPSTANGALSPATSPLRLSSRLQHGITWDWLRLHVGDGSHNHNCGERKYSLFFRGGGRNLDHIFWVICLSYITISVSPSKVGIKKKRHILLTMPPKVGMVTMMVVLIPAACMICYHYYVRWPPPEYVYFSQCWRRRKKIFKNFFEHVESYHVIINFFCN